VRLGRLGRDLFALSSDLHRHLWQEVRDDELRHALYSEGEGFAAGPLSKRVDQCNRQLARRVLCGGDPQHCCGSHGARRVAADATPTGAHAGFFHEQAEMIGQSGRWKSDFTKCSALDRRTSKSPTPSKSQDFFADWVQTWSAAPDSASSSMLGCAAETGLAGWGT
jgi:hypothetical protein